MVSVVIPAYRVAPFIAEAVESVLAQTYHPFEVIVINDGCPDTAAMEAVLAPFQDRIRYLVQPNQGAGAARNTGIEAALGRLIAFLDSDDIWYPEFLSSQVELLRRGGFDMVYSNALLFGDHMESGLEYMQTAPSHGEVTLESLLDMRCNAITSGTLIRRDVLVTAGLFDTTLRRGQDFDMWLRLAHAGARIGYQKTVLLKYRVRSGSLSGNALDRVRRELDVFRTIRNKLDLTPRLEAIIDRQLHRLEGAIELERGKESLAGGDYEGAKARFQSAWKMRPGLKLFGVRVLLAVSPGLLRWLYVRFRASSARCSPRPTR